MKLSRLAPFLLAAFVAATGCAGMTGVSGGSLLGTSAQSTAPNPDKMCPGKNQYAVLLDLGEVHNQHVETGPGAAVPGRPAIKAKPGKPGRAAIPGEPGVFEFIHTEKVLDSVLDDQFKWLVKPVPGVKLTYMRVGHDAQHMRPEVSLQGNSGWDASSGDDGQGSYRYVVACGRDEDTGGG